MFHLRVMETVTTVLSMYIKMNVWIVNVAKNVKIGVEELHLEHNDLKNRNERVSDKNRPNERVPKFN